MQSLPDTVVPNKRSARLGLLFSGLLLSGAVPAQPAQNAAEPDIARQPATPPAMYRVINLETVDGGATVAINAHGQVAYDHSPDPFGPVRTWFYDGRVARDIGDLGNPDLTTLTGLNNAGQVTGLSRDAAGNIRSYVWSRQRGMVNLGVLPGTDGVWGPAINGAGVVAGYATGPNKNRAYRWRRLGGIEDIGALYGGADGIAYARAINDAGVIAGDSWTGADYHAFIWSDGAGMVDIDTIRAGASTPIGISAGGEVAGNYWYGGDVRGFVWTRAGGMRHLGGAADVGSWLTGMSSGGRIIGQLTGTQANPIYRAMTWTRQTGLRDLGTLGGSISTGIAVNNLGQVTGGTATRNDARFVAYVWHARHGMVDLNTRLRHAPAGLVLESAVAISDNGAIVARSNAGLVLLQPDQGQSCPHTVGPIAATAVVAVGATLDAALDIAGNDHHDRHAVSWRWGDGAISGTQSSRVRAGAWKASARHSFAQPGIYTVTAQVTDRAGRGVTVSRKIVVRDPAAGAAGGAGTFFSPHQAGKPTARLAGMARFSFIARPPAGGGAASMPAALHVNAGTFDFRSTNLKAVADRSARGQFEGSGAINGAGNYRFTLGTTATATAAGKTEPGRILLKIWQVDPTSGNDVIVYDNGGAAPSLARATGVTADAAGSALTEGRIVLD